MKITIFNKNNIAFKKDKYIKNIITSFFKTYIEINIIILDQTSIKNVNKKYRHKNTVTDIITFKNKIKTTTIDIMLCPDIIKKKHKKNLKKILIHGLLHIIKYDHEKLSENNIMEKTQQIIGMSGIEPPTITTSK
ncbi:MAG TPA: rRNA maturation RNase YbeY [Candidatus Azoamicus sp.]